MDQELKDFCSALAQYLGAVVVGISASGVICAILAGTVRVGGPPDQQVSFDLFLLAFAFPALSFVLSLLAIAGIFYSRHSKRDAEGK